MNKSSPFSAGEQGVEIIEETVIANDKFKVMTKVVAETEQKKLLSLSVQPTY